MRLKGLEEETVRQFAYKYSGKRWEEFYEAVFGYEAKLAAREWARGETGKGRETFAAWREPVIAWIDAKQEARQQAKEKKHLQEVEERSLEAAGENAAEARRKASQFAETLVGQAMDFKQAARNKAFDRAQRKASLQQLFEAARRPEIAWNRPRPAKRLSRQILKLAFGAKIRFVVGAVLLAGCLLWIKQNELISAKQIQESAAGVVEMRNAGDLESLKEKVTEKLQGFGLPTKETEPLSLPGVPSALTGLFKSIAPGVAGIILIASALWGSWMFGIAVWCAAFVAIFGSSLGVPSIGPISPTSSSLGAALAIAFCGFLFLRNRR
jgi:hypothetical protein